MPEDMMEQLEQVREEIEFFAEKWSGWHGAGHLILARHAAFPVSVTVDMLYQIWANFKTYPDEEGTPQVIPMLAVSDLLLSSLFRQTGKDVYELQPDTRACLLDQLRNDPRFGAARLQQLAGFLYQYISEQPDRPEWKNFKEAQRWTAMLTINPDGAAAQIMQALVNKIDGIQINASLGIANMIETFAKDNLRFAEQVAARIQQPEAGTETAAAMSDAGPKKLVLSGQAVAGSTPFTINLPPYVSNRLKRIKTVVSARAAAAAAAEGKVVGMFVGISEYQQPSMRLRSADKDALNFSQCLQEHKLIKQEDIHLVLNSDATKAVIQSQVAQLFEDAGPNDFVLVYFSGHAVNTLEESSLVLYNYNADERAQQGSGQDKITAQEFNGWISRTGPAHPAVVLILDTHAGSREWLNETDPRHTLIMASHLQQSVGEIAFGGYFTAALIQAIHESKGRITYKNLYKRACEQLQQNAALLNKQTPLFISSEWDTYIFTHKKINPVLPVQLLLQEFGYPINTDGIDGPETAAAKQAFIKDHGISDGERIRFYLKMKKTIQTAGSVEPLIVSSASFHAQQQKIPDELFESEDYLSKRLQPFDADSFSELLPQTKHDPDFNATYHQIENVFAIRGTVSQNTSVEVKETTSFIEDMMNCCSIIVFFRYERIARNFDQMNQQLELLVDLAFALDKEILLITDKYFTNSNPVFEKLQQRYPGIIRGAVSINAIRSFNIVELQTHFNKAIQPIVQYINFLKNLLTVNRKKSARTLDASYTEAVEQARQTGRLDISNQNLPEIPAVVFELSHLEELHASGNQIKHIPPAIAQLSQLKVLNLNGNPITLLPPELMQLQQLETLSLSNTDLRELPADTGKLRSLQQLYIHGTRLVMLPDALADLKQLKVLDARENHILNVPPAVLRGKTAPKKFRAYIKSFPPRTNEKPVLVLLGRDIYMPGILPKQLRQKLSIEVKEDISTPAALYEILRKGVADQCLIYIADPQKIFEQFAYPDLHSWQHNMNQFFALLNGQKINLFYDLSDLSVYMLEDLPGILAINAIISTQLPRFTNITSRFTHLFFEQYLAGSSISKSYNYAQQHTQNKNTDSFSDYILLKNNRFTDSKLPVVKQSAKPSSSLPGKSRNPQVSFQKTASPAKKSGLVKQMRPAVRAAAKKAAPKKAAKKAASRKVMHKKKK